MLRRGRGGISDEWEVKNEAEVDPESEEGINLKRISENLKYA